MQLGPHQCHAGQAKEERRWKVARGWRPMRWERGANPEKVGGGGESISRFFPSPAAKFAFCFLSLWGSRGIVAAIHGRGPPQECLGFSAFISCKPKRALWVVHVPEPRPQFHEKTSQRGKTERNWPWEMEKERNFWVVSGGGGQVQEQFLPNLAKKLKH